MDIGPNIFHAVVFDLHPKIREFLDSLDQSGQIDHDENNAPHIISVDPMGQSVHRCIFIRNGKPENFVLHTRRRADPIRSWADADGYKRKDTPKDEPKSRKERDRSRYPFESIMEQILPKRRQ
jgi:hypothetical protein